MYLKSCRILGVSVGANETVIKKAYRQLAKRYHPDVSTEKNAKEKFILVRRAYMHLSNKDAYQFFLNRQVYNRQRRQSPPSGRPVRRPGYKAQQVRYKEAENTVDAPEYVEKFGVFLEKIYDYLFIFVALLMIFSPPIYFLLDDDLEIDETGWSPIIFPAIFGVAFIYGIYRYLLIHRHPMALKFKRRIDNLKKRFGLV